MSIFERKLFEQKEKPEVLYVSTQTSGIDTLTPRKGNLRDENEGAVIFSTPDIALATMFLIDGHHDSWVKIGYYGEIPCAVICMDRDEFVKRDKGGVMYEVPSDSFDFDPNLGMGNKEWTSKVPVKTTKEQKYASSLDAMIDNGVQVYFVDRPTFEAIWEADDHGRSILSSLSSENMLRNKNIKDMSEFEEIDVLSDEDIKDLIDMSRINKIVVDIDTLQYREGDMFKFIHRHIKDRHIYFDKKIKPYLRIAENDSELETFLSRLDKLLSSRSRK